MNHSALNQICSVATVGFIHTRMVLSSRLLQMHMVAYRTIFDSNVAFKHHLGSKIRLQPPVDDLSITVTLKFVLTGYISINN